ncbi:MAG: hypothetical protein EZS28_035431 [Streblomastix strix]|uniref:Uncharacterized protein n=1 Tax=Streblomastix strix TaxID=222440 RepID=A0A5J4UGL9_9EUKA|nr:MAG: hypothetical protein EZS28_035431 [Streblomastix strix]
MNELFIQIGALSGVVPKASEPEEEPLLRQSFHISFGKDISSELSNKRLCFLHYCPGHTRIDDIKELQCALKFGA